MISVVVPTYNCERFLPLALDSVLGQTYKAYEIIVVDDGSTDGTKEVLKPYLHKIIYEVQQNKGPAAARNKGINLSSGKYIAFLDADDIWLPEKLQKQAYILENNPEVAIVYCKIINVDEKGREVGLSRKKRQMPSGTLFYNLYSWLHILPSTAMIRKEAFKSIGLFDESLRTADELDMWLRIAHRFKIMAINEYLVKYRNLPNSLCKNRERVLKDQLYVAAKIFNLFQNREPYINKRLYYKRLCALNISLGKHSLRTKERQNALHHFKKALHYRPIDRKALRYYLFTFFKN